MSKQAAIKAAANADKAVAAYDAYVMPVIGVDAFTADMLAADAAAACQEAVRAGRGHQPAWLLKEYSAHVAFFRAIAGVLA
jgi:hypothetical protein